ncbi:MAG TPA: transglycosylase family protein, partial [Beutenbergiaceae bacterium]|nr:transglycosylase family protein [Beutenbergiaceae bacterium]
RPAPEPEPEPEPSSGSESGDSGSSSGSGGSGSSDSGSDGSGSEDSGSDDPPGDSGGVPDGVWSQLAQCESGGDPTAVSPSGTYHGLYQFSVATWQSVGGSGLPSEASPAEQTQRAQALQARSGWGQWPACAASLGLL